MNEPELFFQLLENSCRLTKENELCANQHYFFPFFGLFVIEIQKSLSNKSNKY